MAGSIWPARRSAGTANGAWPSTATSRASATSRTFAAERRRSQPTCSPAPTAPSAGFAGRVPAASAAAGSSRSRRASRASCPPAARSRSCSAAAGAERAVEHAGERHGSGRRVERLDEQARVADLAAPAAAHEAPQLLLDRLPAPRGLLLQRAEGVQLAVCLGDRLDRAGAERADQLALEVRLAGEEADPLEVVAERLAELPLLGDVVEAGQGDAERAEVRQEAPDCLS